MSAKKNKKVWTHKSYGLRTYEGRYIRDYSNERVFVLTGFAKNGAIHNKTYESPKAALDAGWIKS